MFVIDDKSDGENEETEEDSLTENTGNQPNTYSSNSKHVSEPAGVADDSELTCKWGPVRATCCNSFRTPQMVLFILCWACCIQSMIVNGFINVIISSLEKRFDLKSTDSGLIASSYDIAVILCLIPVTYFGGIGSKPRWLGVGMIIVGIGAFVFTIPHFTAGLYKFSDTLRSDTICDVTTGNLTGNNKLVHISRELNHYKYVLIIGMMLLGVGAAPLYSLGVTYLDENVEQKWSSVYLGVFYTMAIAGPAFGFALGGYFLSFYTDFDKVNTTMLTISTESVSWVGAWWVGFLIAGSFSVIIGCLILGFPQALPGSSKLRAKRVSEAYAGHERVNTHTADIGSIKDFHKSLKLLLINPTYVLLNFAGSCEAVVIAGTSIFIPKYVEYQFSISATFAALLIGLGTVIGGAAGTFFGGYMIKRLDLKVNGIIQMCMITSGLAALGQLGILFRCPDVHFAGVSHHYNGTIRSHIRGSEEVSLHAGCNAACACGNTYFNPVCAESADNDVMYFTACAAGCTHFTTDTGTKVYQNCSCVGSLSDATDYTVRESRCSSNCDLMIVFVVIFSLVLFFTFATVIPGLSATLRCVPYKQRSFSVGIQWIIVRLLGTIPGPILYGVIIDRSCLFWHQPREDVEDGACYFYDSKHLSHYLLGITLGSKGLAFIFYILSRLTYKAPQAPGKADTEGMTMN